MAFVHAFCAGLEVILYDYISTGKRAIQTEGFPSSHLHVHNFQLPPKK